MTGFAASIEPRSVSPSIHMLRTVVSESDSVMKELSWLLKRSHPAIAYPTASSMNAKTNAASFSPVSKIFFWMI